MQLLKVILFVSSHTFLALAGVARCKRLRSLSLILSPSGKNIEFQDFEHPNAVYARVCVDRKEFYIGMTSVGVAHREAARIRKFKQKSMCYREPALLWWEQHQCFYQFICIPIWLCQSKEEAFIKEATEILSLNAPLNVPFIMRRLQKKTPRNNFKSHTWSMRARKRLRKGRTRMSSLIRRRATSAKNWSDLQCLYWLAEGDRPSFVCQQLLGHHSLSPKELYRLLRVATSLEEPKRSKLRAELKMALNRRFLTVPSAPCPLKLPSLAHESYRKEVKELLQVLRAHSITEAIPHHLPPVSFVETAWPSINKIIGNFRRPNCQGCRCHIFRHLDKSCFSGSGHLVLEGQNLKNALNLESDIVFWSSKQAFWPTLQEFQDCVRKGIEDYWNHHFLPFPYREEMMSIVEQWTLRQWQLHASPQNLAKARDLEKLRRAASWLIFSSEDHCATKIVAFCAKLHYDVTVRTFSDPAIWSPQYGTVKETIAALQQQIPRGQIKENSASGDFSDHRLLRTSRYR